MNNNTVANIVFILHLLFILFILVIPFTNSPIFLILHIVTCISLFIHWQSNSDVCCLTSLEAKMRGIESSETFIHRLVSPVYTISNRTIYSLTFLLMSISVYKLYGNAYKFKLFASCVKNNQYNHMTLIDIINCIWLLF